MAILSIQSAVTYGHVGNAAAVFTLQRLGFECWPVNTVLFSNHPGHEQFAGRAVPTAEVTALLDGLNDLGVLDQCQAVLSGYLGSPDTADTVERAIGQARAANPDALYCCDPVMGDRAEGLYVHPDLAAKFRDRLVPKAQIVTPNAFELEQLTGQPTTTRAQVATAAQTLAQHLPEPGIVMVTSLTFDHPREIETHVYTKDQGWSLTTPLLPLNAKGAGDTLAALFLGHYLCRHDAPSSLAAAASALYAVIEMTVAAQADELHLIPAQTELFAPTRLFDVVAL